MEAARPATAADLAVVAALVGAAIDEKRDVRGGELWRRTRALEAPFEDELEAALAADDRILLVGTIDGVVVGYAAAHVSVLADGGRLAVLTDLFTLDGARGVGVGESMMDLVIEWSGAQGCLGIDSVALPGDRATKNFFETFGLVARALRVHRPC